MEINIVFQFNELKNSKVFTFSFFILRFEILPPKYTQGGTYT